MATSAKKAATKKATPKVKAAGGQEPAAGKKSAKKTLATKKAAEAPAAAEKSPARKTQAAVKFDASVDKPDHKVGGKLPAAFVRKQHTRLLELRDSLLDSMIGVARDNLRSRAEGSEASAFGMHQADAGSDAYDRDFALNLLSQEQDALYEIEEALKRIEAGTYGVCEISGEIIPLERLEAIPFARCTVACQTQLENEKRNLRVRRPVTSLFGIGEGESDSLDEDSSDQ